MEKPQVLHELEVSHSIQGFCSMPLITWLIAFENWQIS